MNLTYDVRLWGIREHKTRTGRGKKAASTFRVRWLVAGEEFGESFQTKPLAESFRSRLLLAQREGVAFDADTGMPEPIARGLSARSWYEHAVEFVDMKWPHASPRHRVSIAESLAQVTLTLLAPTRGAPSDEEIRRALYGWCFNKHRRESGPPPAELYRAAEWVRQNTIKLTDMNDPARIRKALDALGLLLDGTAAAATTVARKRAVFYGALQYGVELHRFVSHPMDHVQWTAPRSHTEVDRRSVVNPEQGLRLLAAVADRWPRYVAFFACMYFAAMRPAEVIHLRLADCTLPERGWGLFGLTGSTQPTGEGWGDDPAATREDRELKHRAANAVRWVPIPPPLVRALLWHVAVYGTAPDGRIFRTAPGNGPVSKWSYLNVWRQARAAAFTPKQQASPLAARPYDLRHAAVSTWLNAGVPSTQVAEWAGHSVSVLLRTYAKCIDGQEEAARRNIARALGLDPEDYS